MSRALHFEVTASSQIVPVGERAYFAGISFTGFTSVKIHDGDVGGNVVFQTATAGVYSIQHEVMCNNGLYIEVAGTGTASVWII